MSTNFGPPDAIIAGRRVQAELKEQPSVAMEVNGSADITSTQRFGQPDRRMAGQLGGRALELLNDPAAAKTTQSWMKMFSNSNDGFAWNGGNIEEGNSPSNTQQA